MKCLQNNNILLQKIRNTLSCPELLPIRPSSMSVSETAQLPKINLPTSAVYVHEPVQRYAVQAVHTVPAALKKVSHALICL